jgi:hypothetical protein
MNRPTRALQLTAITSLMAAALCAITTTPGCGPREQLLLPDAGPPPDARLADASTDAGPEIALDLIRVLPDHGPYSGGQSVILRGAGFVSSAIGVQFGDVAVPASDVRRIDPNRLEVVVPAHAPGAVDVSIDDGETQRTLASGYTYDAVAINPIAGPPSGRTRLTLTSASDAFTDGTEVRLDGLTCTELEIVGPREARCRTPAHSLGVVDVEVDAGPSALTLAAAFTYENPFRAFGGLGGGPLDGTLTVLVRDFTQAPLPGALVIAGAGGALTHRAITGADGTVVFTGDDLRGRVDVFASYPCHHHAGFVGLDAAYVTAGLQRASIGCRPGGGSGGLPPSERTGTVSGELVFYEGQEFPSPVWNWAGVPEPAAGQHRVAYVSLATGRDLHDGTSATVLFPVRVTDELRGARGYPFEIEGARGASALVPFAIAGIEGDEPGDGEPGDPGDPRGGSISESFVPYVVGLGEPVLLPPSRVLAGVEVRMDTPLGEGRDVSAAVPADPPRLGFEHVSLDGTLTNAPLDRLHLLVRYAVPGLAAGLPLGLGPASDEPSGAAGGTLHIERQPQGIGSFAAAEQEVFAILTGEPEGSFGGSPPTWPGAPSSFLGPSSPYRRPHTRVVVRAPLATTALHATDFLGIPAFAGDFDQPLPGDRTLRFTLDDVEGATLIRIRVLRPFGLGFAANWFVLAHPSTRALTLPDLSSEVGFEPLPPGRNLLQVGVYDVPSLDFDRIDTRSIDSLPIRRSSYNTTSFVVE